MQRSYKFSIKPCDRPSQYLDEAHAKTRVMNLCRQELRDMISMDKSHVIAEEYTFTEFNWEDGTVKALYNPMPER